MKTATIELPDAVFERLAREANRKRKPVPAYIADLLSTVGTAAGTTAKVEPELPLVPSRRPGAVKLTGRQIAEIESAEDAQCYGRTAGR